MKIPKIPGLKQRHRVLIYSLVAVLIAGAIGALTEIRSDRFRSMARDFLVSMCARRIEVGEASFNLMGRVTLRDVRIYNDTGYASPLLFSAPVIRFQLGMTGGETSAFRPTRITIEKPEIWFERDWKKPWNTDQFWVKKPPRRDHPTFSLPISISNATIHLDDGRIGNSGIKMNFDDVAINHTVMSDGIEITNNTAATDIRLPGGGGVMDLTLFTHPNARKAHATLIFHGADVTKLKPYVEFLRIVSFEAGTLDGRFRINFESGVVSYDAKLHVEHPVLSHPASGARPSSENAAIEFRSTTRDSRVAVEEFSFRWKRTLLTGGGVFSTRNSPDSFLSFLIETNDGRSEDLAFLLCDPSFEPSGRVTGGCRLFSQPDGEAYEVELNLDQSDAPYGTILKKPAGAHGRLAITGRSRSKKSKAGLDRISIEIGSSRFSVDGPWSLQAKDLRFKIDQLSWSDVKRFVPGAMDSLAAYVKLDGVASGEISVSNEAKHWRIAPKLRLDQSVLDLTSVGIKPRGMSCVLSMEAALSDGKFSVSSGKISVGNTELGITGSVDDQSNQFVLTGRGTGLDGLRAFLAPKLWPALSRIVITGDGDIDVSVNGGRDGMKIVAKLDARDAAMILGDTWSKPAGEAFSIATTILRSSKGTAVEDFKVTQGKSLLTCKGTVSAGNPAMINADVSAKIDVPEFLRRTPALEKVKVSGRKASDSLKLIADRDQIATLNGKLTGTLDQPKLSWLAEQLLTRVILKSLTSQLTAITSLFTNPVKQTLEIFRRKSGSDTPVNSTDSPSRNEGRGSP